MNSAAEVYAARVDAVLTQRTRLRGLPPAGDLFAGLAPDHPLMASDPRRELEPALAAIAAMIGPDDVVLDVGGGAGRNGLPLALRCREVVNVEPSGGMRRGWEANAARGGVTNVRFVQESWPATTPLDGDVVLVNHVTYLTRDIVPFIEALQRAARRRVIITVNHPPPPSWNRRLFALVHGEEEEVVPGHVELINVLWEMGILPDVHVLPRTAGLPPPAPSREAAINAGVGRFHDQWALWPLGDALEARVRGILTDRFDDLFRPVDGGYLPAWVDAGREVMATWQVAPQRRSHS